MTEIILSYLLGLTINTGQCDQVGCLSQRWQVRQGVAKLPIQILGALIGKSAIIGVLHYPDLRTLLMHAYPWEINHNFDVLMYAGNRRVAKSRLIMLQAECQMHQCGMTCWHYDILVAILVLLVYIISAHQIVCFYCSIADRHFLWKDLGCHNMNTLCMVL